MLGSSVAGGQYISAESRRRPRAIWLSRGNLLKPEEKSEIGLIVPMGTPSSAAGLQTSKEWVWAAVFRHEVHASPQAVHRRVAASARVRPDRLSQPGQAAGSRAGDYRTAGRDRQGCLGLEKSPATELTLDRTENRFTRRRRPADVPGWTGARFRATGHAGAGGSRAENRGDGRGVRPRR